MYLKGFRDCNIYVEGKGIVKTSLLVENDKILEISNDICEEGLIHLPSNLYVVPGFIDKHIHGANNADFMYTSKADIEKILGSIHLEGTTSCLATTMTQDMNNILKSVKNIGEYIDNNNSGVEILGIHLEGPFVSKSFAGAQPLGYIKSCDISKLEEIIKQSNNHISQVSYAYEENGSDFTKYLVENKIVASIGHSNASYEEMEIAASLGANSITHTYNAQRGIHHRDIGVAGAALLNDKFSCELICDLIHVSAGAIKLLYKNKGKDNICLITDSIEAKYMPDGIYKLGGQDVFVKNNAARLENNTLAGSTLKMNEGIRNFKDTLNLSLTDAIDCATKNPAKILGVYDRKGSIKVGKDADFVVIDENLNVLATICRGKIMNNKI